MQGRGSLHAHIVLWVAPEDAHKFKQDVTAEIPGLWDPLQQKMMRPADPVQAELYDLVCAAMTPAVVVVPITAHIHKVFDL